MGPVNEPAYTRLGLVERRRQLLEAGTALFAEHAYEEISMRQIAAAAGVSKPLLYHYFPAKVDLFKAAVAEAATELAAAIQPRGDGSPVEQLSASIDAYLIWIGAHARAWRSLMRSAAAVPEAAEVIGGFRDGTLSMVLSALSEDHQPRPALRIALRGWLGYMDAAILDWTEHELDLSQEALRNLLLSAFAASLTAAQQADPEIRLRLSG